MQGSGHYGYRQRQEAGWFTVNLRVKGRAGSEWHAAELLNGKGGQPWIGMGQTHFAKGDPGRQSEVCRSGEQVDQQVRIVEMRCRCKSAEEAAEIRDARRHHSHG
jgi:hypothetical protein